MISRSVAQIATASMRTSTSAFFGTGTGLSLSDNSPGLPRTQAFIVSGIGKLGSVLTPAGAYIWLLLDIPRAPTAAPISGFQVRGSYQPRPRNASRGRAKASAATPQLS